MIIADDVVFLRAGRPVLDHVHAVVAAGRVTVAIGPNGAGKSTLLRVLAGDLKPLRGTVSYGGTPIGGWTPAALARRRAVLPQASGLAFPFTVHEIVRLGAVASGSRIPDRGAAAALAAAGIPAFGNRLFQQLSGGEQQRVHFARTLAQVPEPVVDGMPRALLLDEPTSSLDLRQQIAVLDVARDYARRGGAVFAILHDLNLAAEYADHLLVLDEGRVVENGPPTAALLDRVVAGVYGVRGAVARLPRPEFAYVLPQARVGTT